MDLLEKYSFIFVWEHAVKRKFKWLSIYREACPIYNGTI